MKPRLFPLLLLIAAGGPVHAGFVWLGTSTGLTDGPNTSLGGDGDSIYGETNWDDDAISGLQAAGANTINNSAQVPAGIAGAVSVSNGGVAGGANGGGTNTAHFRTNGNAVSVSGATSGLKMAVNSAGAAAWFENDGTTGGSQSSLSISGGFVTTGALKDISATLTGSTSRLLFISNGDNGLAGNNSTLDLTGGIWSDSATIHWTSITSAQLFVSGVLGSLTVNGVPAVWGSDPLVFETGDTVLATEATFVRTGTEELPQNNWYGSTRSGFSLIAVPEPGSALLALLGASLLGRRRR